MTDREQAPALPTFVLTLDCPDRAGIVHAVSGLLVEHGGNILESQQFGDSAEDRFFMRVRFTAPTTLEALRSAFAPVALAFGILDLPGATPTTLSVVLASEAVAVVLFILVGGVISDRYPRHRVLQAAEWVNAVAHAALAVMVGTERAPLWGLVAAAVVSGTATATVWPALTGIIPEVVPAEHLQQGNALLALGVNIARVTRPELRRVLQSDFVLAGRASGLTPAQNLWRHLLPNVAPVFIVQLSWGMAVAVLAEAGLSYLGFGAPVTEPSWGLLLAQLQQFIGVHPLSVVWPGLAITITVLGLNLLADGLREESMRD